MDFFDEETKKLFEIQKAEQKIVNSIVNCRTDRERIEKSGVVDQSKAIKMNKADQILELHYQGKGVYEISRETSLPYLDVYKALQDVFRNEKTILTKNEELAQKSIEWSMQVANKIITKIEEFESFMKQLGFIDPLTGELKVNLSFSAEYIQSWKILMDSLKWWIEKRIELSGMQETQAFREAVLEAIREEDPAIAAKIRAVVEQKRKDRGLF